MQYISTRNNQDKYTLQEAAFMGLAPDGGLFMPERIPQVDMDEVLRRAARSYNDLAVYLTGLFFGEELSAGQIEQVVGQAYDFEPVLKTLGERLHTLELFHGPTFAFKDFGARFMGQMFGILNDKTDQELIVLTATSGDTGSAVAGGFYRVPGVKVVILYPSGRVSDLQESQMTTLGENIYPVSVAGNFDDCQRLVKRIFTDHAFSREHRITSANSINILRWIPQSYYYFYGYYLWRKATGRETPEIVVPSGNYGNISAGMLANLMGLPVKRFIAASNANDVIPAFLESGRYEPRESLHTVANAMDVGDPSNYERICALYDNDFAKVTTRVKGLSASDEEIKTAIARVKKEFDYWIDPHSAVGFLATEHYKTDGFWLSTAHEAKFREILADSLPASELPTQLPEELARRISLPRNYQTMQADETQLRDYIRQL